MVYILYILLVLKNGSSDLQEATRQITVPRYACLRQVPLYEYGLLKAFLNESIKRNLNSIVRI